jgi:hypothetical protein
MDKNDIWETFYKFGMPREEIPAILMYYQLEELVPCIVLYEGEEIGHWCAILRHPKSWEIFDPIGLLPDQPLDHPGILRIPKKLGVFFENQNVPRGAKWDLEIEYNDFSMQKGGKTCGLWCILRFIHKNLSCDQFRDEFGKMTDEQVCRFFNRMDLLN